MLENYIIVKNVYDFTESAEVFYAEDITYCDDYGNVMFFSEREECELYLESNNLEGCIVTVKIAL